jgi:hypothetical protein
MAEIRLVVLWCEVFYVGTEKRLSGREIEAFGLGTL